MFRMLPFSTVFLMDIVLAPRFQCRNVKEQASLLVCWSPSGVGNLADLAFSQAVALQ